MQQSSFVVIKFDNHAILAEIGLAPERIALLGQENHTASFYFTAVPTFLHSVRSVVMFRYGAHL
ncbi:MAG: hypothetical protein WB781_23985 [Candidatus Sulfotelmatobacter sp.]